MEAPKVACLLPLLIAAGRQESYIIAICLLYILEEGKREIKYRETNSLCCALLPLNTTQLHRNLL